jgi:hypothetical protein
MKKIPLIAMLIGLNSSLLFADTNKNSEVANTEQTVQTIASSQEKLTKEEFNVLFNRLKEIKSMNLHAMNPDDKSKVREEVVMIRDKMKKDGVSVYLSGTAILIIILLLILL